MMNIIYFQDSKIATQILQTNDVAQVKALGRMVSGYDDNYWNGIRQIVVYKGLLAKFSQNEDLEKLLIGTKTAILAECTVRDKIWGIGLSMNDVKRFDRTKWQGQNLLGYTLMMVREQLAVRNC
ncbi:MAG: NADAR family protein [Spirochaetales bacterium]|nr:NADAR family protein [Spirochaetales bacterium]